MANSMIAEILRFAGYARDDAIDERGCLQKFKLTHYLRKTTLDKPSLTSYNQHSVGESANT